MVIAMLKLRDNDVHVTKVNANYTAWGTCGCILFSSGQKKSLDLFNSGLKIELNGTPINRKDQQIFRGVQLTSTEFELEFSYVVKPVLSGTILSAQLY